MMAGGWSALTLPGEREVVRAWPDCQLIMSPITAGYLGSSFIGAGLIACGFSINASKVCSFVLALGFLITLWWSRRDWL